MKRPPVLSEKMLKEGWVELTRDMSPPCERDIESFMWAVNQVEKIVVMSEWIPVCGVHEEFGKDIGKDGIQMILKMACAIYMDPSRTRLFVDFCDPEIHHKGPRMRLPFPHIVYPKVLKNGD